MTMNKDYYKPYEGRDIQILDQHAANTIAEDHLTFPYQLLDHLAHVLMLKEQGEEVHISSVGRYGKKFLNRFESVRVAKEFAKLLAEDNVDRPATELHEANNLLASQLIMEAMLDDTMDADDKATVAKSIASLQSAQVRNEKLKIEARKEQGAVHVAMELLKEKVFAEIGQNHPDIAATLLELAENTERELSKMQ